MARRAPGWFPTQKGSASRRAASSKAKRGGTAWSSDLAEQCAVYRLTGDADIWPTEAPFRVVGKSRDGMLKGFYEAKGSPDFMGLIGPVAFMAEAKRCSGARWGLEQIKPHQAVALERHHTQGHLAGVLLLHGHRRFWLPWSVLGPLFDAWQRGAAKRGWATLSLEQVADLGVEFQGADFLPAVVEAGRG